MKVYVVEDGKNNHRDAAFDFSSPYIRGDNSSERSSLGFPKDCAELEILRWFRDHVLASTPEGRKSIEEYYAIAPSIVTAIDDRVDAKAIYARIFAEMIAPSVDAIRQRRYDDAFQLYRNGANRLITNHLRSSAGGDRLDRKPSHPANV
jgi:hypothetical protein